MKVISEKDIQRIAEVLRVPYTKEANAYRLVLENPRQGRYLALEIYPEIPMGEESGCLISVYTPTSHLQLHRCTAYVVSESLGEVTFVAEHQGRLSGLIIEREAACNLYANVDSSALSGDFTRLGPEVMLSGIALSLVEGVLPSANET
jgi:hypothetical protein